MTAERVTQALTDHGVPFEITDHVPVVTAQQVAAVEHESGWHVAKPVLLMADGTLVMTVLPAAVRLDLDKARELVGAGDVRLATEAEFGERFPDCETGAEPIFGSLYGVPVYVDERLLREPRLVFAAGNHRQTITVATQAFLDLASPVRGQLAAAVPG